MYFWRQLELQNDKCCKVRAQVEHRQEAIAVEGPAAVVT